ncbi:MAG TPA: transporter substrate-binding domain-containing protein [Coleofasciculaceae cyanobacterium]
MLNEAKDKGSSRAIAEDRDSVFRARVGTAKFLFHRLLKLSGCRLSGLATGFSLLAAILVVAVPQAGQAAELQEILKRGYLVVGVKDHLRPLAFRDGQGQLEGFEIDLAHYLAAELLGNPAAVVLKPLSNVERLPAVLNDDVDLAIAQVTATVSRARIVNFSTPYYLDGAAFVTRNPAIQELQDLQQQRIAVLNGSDTIAVVRSLLPQVSLVGVDSYDAAKTALENGQATAFAADASVLTGWAQEDSQYHVLPHLITADPLAVAMPRGLQYDELRRRVNQAIDRWRTDGRLRQQVLRWGLPETGVPSPVASPNSPS